MNDLGWIILGAAVRATALAAIGLLAVVALKRRGPSAGALAGSTTMLVMVGVTALAVSPWPRWWSPELVKPVAPPIVGSSPAIDDPQLAGTSRPASLPKVEPAETATWSDFVREFRHQMAKPSAIGPQVSWTWPAWMACLFLSGLAIALFRLGLGLWAVRSLQSRSTIIDAPPLLEELTRLRAELGLELTIELRESTEISTPAMVGWRRPSVILPEGWAEWEETERRAVLAHELAHIYRGDYLTGLLAQLSLSLHFYHPLAHFLARRLRLQQELAADALGASLAGGRRPYLTALANLALRQDPRPAAWPARPFLPTRGTFLRRIEMLRDPNALQHRPMRRASRILTVATLTLAGILVAGFRGPGRPVLAQDLPLARSVSLAAQGLPPLDPITASSDAHLVIDLRPAQLLKNPEIKKLVESLPGAQAKGGPEAATIAGDIEQVVILGFERRMEGVPANVILPPQLVFLFRSAKPIDWKPFMAPKVEEVKSDGITYFRSGKLAGASCFRVIDDRTLLTGTEADVKLPPMGVERPKSRHGWDEAWSKLAPSPIRVGLDASWLAKQILPPVAPGRPGGASPMMGMFGPLFEKARAYAIALDVADGLTLDGFATCATEEGSQRVADTLRACLALGRNALPDLRQAAEAGSPQMARATSDMLDALDAMLDSAKVQQDGSVTKLNAKADAATIANAAKLVLPAVSASREAARRSQCINNLKQIMLAMHNYHAANECFPPAVLYGPDGKTPYSWRVALLPYLEQAELYKAYKFDEPWDGPSNSKLVEKMPAVFGCPDDPEALGSHFSSYYVPHGPTTLFPDRKAGMKIAEITDGTSLTIAVIEAKRQIPWSKPEDIPFIEGLPSKAIGQLHPAGYTVGFADGSVRFLKETINEFVLKALFTRAGGEAISRDAL